MQYTNLVDIDALLPPDVPIQWRKRKWLIPGDIETGKILALEQALEGMSDAGATKDREVSVAAFQRLADVVQSILAVRQPEDAQGLTFGPREVGVLAMTIWAAATGKLKASGGEAPAGDGDPGNAKAAVAQ